MPSKNKNQATQNNSKNRGKNFSEEEVNFLLDLVEEHLPLGGDQWDLLVLKYNMNKGFPNRDKDALRNKFLRLRNVKKPTGDPNIPPEVLKAKRCFRLMEQKQSIATMDQLENDGYDDDELESNNGNEDAGQVEEEANNDRDDLGKDKGEEISEEDISNDFGANADNQVEETPNYFSQDELEEANPSTKLLSQVFPADYLDEVDEIFERARSQSRLSISSSASASSKKRKSLSLDKTQEKAKKKASRLGNLIGENSGGMAKNLDTTSASAKQRRNLDKGIENLEGRLKQETDLGAILFMQMQESREQQRRYREDEMERRMMEWRLQKEEKEERERIRKEEAEERERIRKQEAEERRKDREESEMRWAMMFAKMFNNENMISAKKLNM